MKSNPELRHIAWKDVDVDGGFWGERQRINREVTLAAEYEQCKRTGRIDTFKQKYTPEQTEIPRPHHYWDSDVAKWIEAAAYTIAKHPAPELENKIDEVIDDMEKAQWEDGYINSFFSVMAPSERWSNVYTMHELYCAGHMIEAAVAYFEATGKRKYLDIMCRMADHIDHVFGPGPGKIHGYPGHQEIELALVKLYRLTGDEKHLRLSKYFIDERGKQPLFFDLPKGMEDNSPIPDHKREWHTRDYLPAGPYALFQSHLPVREQKTAEGHAVRVMYQCCAAADLAAECGDETLAEAAGVIWQNVTRRRMYITGGIGPLEVGERFTFDYDLPNETAYNETCASIGLFMWAHRMLLLDVDREYSDVMEQTLYNGIISGISLSGDRFFYSNHLASHPGPYENKVSRNERMLPYRQPWFDVCCCPPNLARLTASIGGYVYSCSGQDLYAHLYVQSSAAAEFGGIPVRLKQTTGYPVTDTAVFDVEAGSPARFALNLRIPGWCSDPRIMVNGSPYEPEEIRKGYARVFREWRTGDRVELRLPMVPRVMEAHPSVRENCGRVAVTYGPLVYCMEEADNGKDLNDIILPAEPVFKVWHDPKLGGVNLIGANALRRDAAGWDGALYKQAGSGYVSQGITLIPYYAWSNRASGEMLVWIRKAL